MIIFSGCTSNKKGPRPVNSTYWVTVDPWIACPDCNGTGIIDLEQLGNIECPCTMKMISPDDTFGLFITAVLVLLMIVLIVALILH